MDDPDTESALLDLERRGWDSLCDGTGAAFYGEIMTEDAMMVLAHGAVMDRDAVVESFEHATPWVSYDIDDVHLVAAGSEGVALVYLGTGYRVGDQPAFVGIMSSVYVRRDGGWRLALYQQMPMSS